jgi:predicted metal-dependent hydrolase
LNTLTIIKKDIKHIYIRIKPPSEVVVTVPLNTKQKTIDNLLEEKSSWINKQLSRIDTQTQNFEYIDGEKISFLGSLYALKIHNSLYNKAELSKNTLHLFTQNPNSKEHKEAIITQWHYKQAKIYFDKAIAKFHPIVNRPIHAVRIKTMKTRWGSCNHTKGYINLNVKLIEKPIEALEYVVFHELVHLIYPNHSKNFYGFIEKYMPDWKERNRLLK